MLSAGGRWLEKYPFLRLDIPYIIGIIACNAGFLCTEWTLPVMVIAGCVFFFLLLALGNHGYTYPYRSLWGILLMLSLLLFGFLRMYLAQKDVTVEWSREPTAYRGWVIGIPEEKEKTWMVPVEVYGKQVLLYLPKDSCSENLGCGDEIYFYTRIYKPLNRGNVDEFDYAAYLLRQGISGTAYANSHSWMKTERKRTLTWKQFALKVREKLISAYRSWGFSGKELAVIAALTLGDKSMLDDSLKNSFSVAGASHILALSGLHLGIVAGILSSLLFFRPSYGRRLWSRGVLIILSLWVFAYITGLSGSVVRSAVMFTVFIVGRCLHRKGVLLNSLALAAFVMLLYNPFYLYDVGFQMSFMAVCGIALFMPVFQKFRVISGNRIVNYVQDLIWISIAAQLGVAPLVVYYFENFPLYFLVTNLVVVPLSFLILSCSVLIWAFCWLEWVHEVLVEGLQFLLAGLNSAVEYISLFPLSSITFSISLPELLVCYVLLLLLLIYYHRRSARPVLCAQVVLCALLLYYNIREWYPRSPQLAFYTDRSQENVIRMTDSNGRVRIIKVHEAESRIVPFSGSYIGVLGDDKYEYAGVEFPDSIDILYVNSHYAGDFNRQLSVFKVKRAVVVDSSLRRYIVDEIEEICKEEKIPLILLSEKGSCKLTL